MYIKFDFDPLLALNNVKKNIINTINKSLNKSFMESVGKILAEDIVRRTRLGYGVKKSNDPRVKLKPLSSKYIEFRKKRSRDLYNLTSTKRSNLTFTGQLLNSLTSKSDRNGKITLFFKGKHKNLDGSLMDNGLLANYVSKDRPFFGPTDRELQRLKTNIKNQILKSL